MTALTDLTNDYAWMGKIIAEECNVKRITFNGVMAYQEPLLKDRYAAKQRQFEEIYNEYSETK